MFEREPPTTAKEDDILISDGRQTYSGKLKEVHDLADVEVPDV